jgi:zinc protease
MAGARITIPKLDTRSLPGPETIARRELANGLIVLARENFASPSVVVAGNLVAGSIRETDADAGLADMTAAALMRGTAKRSFDRIHQTVESIGASLAVGAGSHNTSFRGKALAEDLGTLLDLLNDVLRHPAFPKNEVERLRAEKLTGLALRDQDTSSMAEMAFDSLAYKGHPYAVASDGYPASVASLSVRQLRSFHHLNYGPVGMIVAVVGAVKAKKALDAVEALFGDWKPLPSMPNTDVSDARPLSRILRKNVALAGKTQADIVIGVPGPRRTDPGYLAATLGNSVLGRFGLYGRIGDRVREQEGLAYYAYSGVSGGVGPGPWKVNAGVNPANVNRAIDLIADEIGLFIRRPVTRQELLENQANFIGRLPLQLESNDGVAGGLVYIERHDLGLDYYQKYPKAIRAITRDEIQDVAQRFLDPSRLAIAVAGPRLPKG